LDNKTHKEGQQHLVLELLYDRKHKHGRSIMKSAFGSLKKTFKKIFCKIELDITLVLIVFTCCFFFHNLIFGKAESIIKYAKEIVTYVITITFMAQT
jgi:hypothetical protein